MREDERKIRSKWRSYAYTGNSSWNVVGRYDTDRWKHDRIACAMIVNRYRKGSARGKQKSGEDDSYVMRISV